MLDMLKHATNESNTGREAEEADPEGTHHPWRPRLKERYR